MQLQRSCCSTLRWLILFSLGRMIYAFLLGQFLVVLFIALHDWIPLGRLSNLEGIRATDTLGKRVIGTVLSTLPFAASFGGSLYYARTRFPVWLMWTLWITYGIACYGILRSWWIPYLFGQDPVRAERYQIRFSDTHAFLPPRNGIRPDTLHIGFHVIFAATLGLLVVITFSSHSLVSQ
jgi:hypothetical protein